MNFAVIIQARMSSTRLPGKILKEFSNGKSMLDMQIDTLKSFVPSENIYIATTEKHTDDIIEEKYSSICNVYRGSEQDVLSRYVNILKEKEISAVVRISSDNPFILPEGIEYLLSLHFAEKSDYTTFSIEGIPSMLVPCGLYAEVVSSKALLDLYMRANDIEKEHVTFGIYNRYKESYNVNFINVKDFYDELDNKDLRYTVDTSDDFLFIDNIIKEFDIKELSLNILKDILKYGFEHIEEMKNESNKKKNLKLY